MIIKKFVGKTEEEAVENARKDLGEGAVIMNVKSVKRKGIFALFGGKLIEVTAALEEENVQQTVSDVARKVEQQPAQFTSGLATQNNSAENIEKRLDSLQALLENQLKKAEEANQVAAVRENTQDAFSKVEEKQDEVEERTENMVQDKFIRLLYNTMLDNEVDEKYANQILEDIEKCKNPNTPFDYILTNTYQKMVLKFGKSEGIVPAKQGPKIVLFMGPTGVGKTTTIAKIASTFTMDEKKQVALLTADTYRIAAAEQLRTYANILEVPFRVIYTCEEFNKAIEDYNEYDYIFVDTAGHSHQNKEQLENMNKMMECLDGVAEYQTFLVLSATTKYRDLLKISESYQTITDYQLIFTKLDETNTLGNLLNVKLYTDTTIAYVTGGQNVPDDIETFNPQKTVKQLLGGKM